MAIEAHRRNMPVCMGSLYWQLNDCWPVASWSGIDNYGNWKAMHYFVKKAFNDILVSPDIDNNGRLRVTIVSDKLKSIEAKLKLSILNFNGITLWSQEKHIDILKNSSTIYFDTLVSSIINGMERSEILLHASLLDLDDEILSENVNYFLPIANLNLPVPVINSTIEETEGGFIISLSTDKLAKNLYLRADEVVGMFSDNYFELMANKSIKIKFNTNEQISLEKFKASLNIFTLVDSY